MDKKKTHISFLSCFQNSFATDFHFYTLNISSICTRQIGSGLHLAKPRAKNIFIGIFFIHDRPTIWQRSVLNRREKQLKVPASSCTATQHTRATSVLLLRGTRRVRPLSTSIRGQMDGGGRRVGEGQEETNKAFLMPHDGV